MLIRLWWKMWVVKVSESFHNSSVEIVRAIRVKISWCPGNSVEYITSCWPWFFPIFTSSSGWQNTDHTPSSRQDILVSPWYVLLLIVIILSVLVFHNHLFRSWAIYDRQNEAKEKAVAMVIDWSMPTWHGSVSSVEW